MMKRQMSNSLTAASISPSTSGFLSMRGKWTDDSNASTGSGPSTPSIPETCCSLLMDASSSNTQRPSDQASQYGWDQFRHLPPPLYWTLKFLCRIFFIDLSRAKKVPLLRGKIHLLLLYLSPLWIVSLFRCCASRLSILTVLLSTVSSLFNFSASALLHNRDWSDLAFHVMTKLDYVGIFLMISGSCSPVAILLYSSYTRVVLLLVQWTAAFFGICMCIFGRYSDENHSARAVVYLIVGLSNVAFIRYFLQTLFLHEFGFLLSMGVFYVVGATFYAMKKPNLWPGVFGYHELFHLCCLAAGVCTYLLNRSVLLRS